MVKRLGAMICSCLLVASILCISPAYAAQQDAANGQGQSAESSEDIASGEGSDSAAAADSVQPDGVEVEVSAEGDAAMVQGASFALSDFSRAQRGSNREVGGSYIGYSYYQGTSDDQLVAIAANDYVVVRLPQDSGGLADLDDPSSRQLVKDYLVALDAASVNGGVTLDADVPWYFTQDASYTVEGVKYSFGVDSGEGSYYVTVTGEDGEDVVSETGNQARPLFVEFARVTAPDAVDIVQSAMGIAAFGEFLSGLDWSPLWVTLKTTGVAIVFIFILGLSAAYFSLRIPKRAQDIADTVFTIPMVLPPTVCGFILLLALGNNSPVGRWFIEHGFSLVFSWPATVIAAVVVAFPLMYRSARGAFETIDANMLDAARTLGWSNARIFFKLMLPLAWSSIAAGTVLAFARALGEFGATLFLAGNYAGITRTIPIAIYFEWMGGDMDTALFWTCVVIAFSFLVILFINLWSKRTTRYRRSSERRAN